MSITIYTSSDEQWCFAEQVTWGTGLSDATAGLGILTEGFNVNSEINFRNPPRARAQRYNTLADMQADQKGVVYQTEGMNTPATLTQLDVLLYGLMQSVTESSGTPFQKTFIYPQAQPDFDSNAGEFFSLWNVQQPANVDSKLYDAIISEITLSCAPDANEGELWVAPTFVGLNHSDTADYSGTITYPSLAAANQYYFYDIVTVTLGGDACILGDGGITITLRNNARKIGQDTGIPQSFALPRYEAELTFNILWDGTARSLMTDAKAGTTVAFVLTWGSSGNSGHLSFTGSAKINNPVAITHAIEGNFVDVNLTAGGTFGGAEPFQVIMSNAVDRGW